MWSNGTQRATVTPRVAAAARARSRCARVATLPPRRSGTAVTRDTRSDASLPRRPSDDASPSHTQGTRGRLERDVSSSPQTTFALATILCYEGPENTYNLGKRRGGYPELYDNVSGASGAPAIPRSRHRKLLVLPAAVMCVWCWLYCNASKCYDLSLVLWLCVGVLLIWTVISAKCEPSALCCDDFK